MVDYSIFIEKVGFLKLLLLFNGLFLLLWVVLFGFVAFVFLLSKLVFLFVLSTIFVILVLLLPSLRIDCSPLLKLMVIFLFYVKFVLGGIILFYKFLYTSLIFTLVPDNGTKDDNKLLTKIGV